MTDGHTIQLLARVAYKGDYVFTPVLFYVSCNILQECLPFNKDSYKLCKHNPIKPETNENSCIEGMMDVVYHNAKTLHDSYKDSLQTAVENTYTSLCMGNRERESLKMTYMNTEHHFTLYYYDQAGNLVRTVPPAGVELVDPSKFDLIREDLKNGTQSVFTNHRMETRYVYNSLNQLVYQYMPDHDAFVDINSTASNNGLGNTPVIGVTSDGSSYGISVAPDPNNSSSSLVYETNDGGQNWNVVQNTLSASLNSIERATNGDLFVGGEDGTLIRSVDNGESWSRVNSSTDENIISLHKGAGTLLFHTTEGATFKKEISQWVKLNNTGLDAINVLKDVSCGADASVAVGYDGGDGALYVGDKDGQKWHEINKMDVKTSDVTHVTMNGDNGYACDRSGMLLYTEDGGKSWSPAPTISVKMSQSSKKQVLQIRDMFMINNDLYALGTDNSLYRRSNGSGTDEKYSWIFETSDVESIGSDGSSLYILKKYNDSSWMLSVKQSSQFKEIGKVNVSDFSVSSVSKFIVSLSNKYEPVYNNSTGMIDLVIKNIYDLSCLTADGVEKVWSLKKGTSEGSNVFFQVKTNSEIVNVTDVVKKGDTKYILKNDGSLLVYSSASSSSSSVVPIQNAKSLAINSDGDYILTVNDGIQVCSENAFGNLTLNPSVINLPRLNAVSVSGNTAVVVGDDGVVLFSVDYKTWKLIPSGKSEDLLAVNVKGSNAVFGGVDGVLSSLESLNGEVKLSDNTVIIKSDQIYDNSNVTELVSDENNLTYIGTNTGFVCKKSLDGLSYTSGTLENSVNCIKNVEGEIWLVGSNGTIFKVNN